MVLDEDLNPLHELTEEGKKEYQIIVNEALVYQKEHPILWQIKKFFRKSND